MFIKVLPKKYSVDLLINNSVLYELKAINKLNPEHDKQALHYLFLLGLQHGKLINFRPFSVEKRFVSTTLLSEDRYNVIIDDKHWHELDDDSVWLKSLLINLLYDWGAYLEITLFYEAINHFRGGEARVIFDIEIILNGAKLGHQKIHLLNPNTAFKITAITKDSQGYQQHLKRFIRLTNLHALQWVNFNHNNISFKTILNSRK